jgi:hypothetical protein
MPDPTVEWDWLWIILHTIWASDYIKVMWFLVIHDLQPINERLHRINLAETSRCKMCGVEDTRLHRLIECQRGRAVWDETRMKLALILHMSLAHLEADRVLKPQFSI